MTNIVDGCYACLPSFDEFGKPIRPPLVKVARVGTLWWTCPKCHGSYGEAGDAQPRYNAAEYVPLTGDVFQFLVAALGSQGLEDLRWSEAIALTSEHDWRPGSASARGHDE